jgi:hypothetical protein
MSKNMLQMQRKYVIGATKTLLSQRKKRCYRNEKNVAIATKKTLLSQRKKRCYRNENVANATKFASQDFQKKSHKLTIIVKNCQKISTFKNA